MEDVIEEIGADSVVRVGARPQSETMRACSLHARSQRSTEQQKMFHKRMKELIELDHKLYHTQQCIAASNFDWSDAQDLFEEEAMSEELRFFTVPNDADRIAQACADGQSIAEEHSWDRWISGEALDPYNEFLCLPLWTLSSNDRSLKLREYYNQWMSILEERALELLQDNQRLERSINALQDDGHLYALRSARVIAATTTGAAKLHDLLEQAEIDTLVLEEAGEILEAHVLCILHESTKRLIMIGGTVSCSSFWEHGWSLCLHTQAAVGACQPECHLFDQVRIRGFALWKLCG